MKGRTVQLHLHYFILVYLKCPTLFGLQDTIFIVAMVLYIKDFQIILRLFKHNILLSLLSFADKICKKKISIYSMCRGKTINFSLSNEYKLSQFYYT